MVEVGNNIVKAIATKLSIVTYACARIVISVDEKLTGGFYLGGFVLAKCPNRLYLGGGLSNVDILLAILLVL